MLRLTLFVLCFALAAPMLGGCAAGPGHTRALGTIGGTATGAALGSACGPEGALAGGIIGLVAGTIAGDAIASDQERCCPPPRVEPVCPPPASYTVVEEVPGEAPVTRVYHYHVHPPPPAYYYPYPRYRYHAYYYR